MNSQDLINYYGSYVVPSDSTLFNFTLNADGETVGVSLADTTIKEDLRELVIPYECEIEGKIYKVISISTDAFANCENLTSVIIPNSVISIGIYAFANCGKLKNINIPNSVTSIGEYAFENCRSLINITIPNSIVTIEEGVFYGCWNLTTIIIPNSVTTIGNDTFTGCSKLTGIFVNSNNIQVGTNAFPIKNSNFTIYTNINSNLVKNKELQPYLFLFKQNNSLYNSHLFIAGVGEVELFKGEDIVLTSKTLIDTGVNLTVNLDEIQGNGGAKLYGKYASQAGMTIKFTEAMFRMEFLAANLGEDIELGGSAVTMEQAIVEDGIIKINGEPQPLYLGSENRVVWVGKQGENTHFLSFSDEDIQDGKGDDFGKTLIKNTPFANGSVVCVKYIKEHEEGQTIKVSSNYLPDEMTAILTASLFAGDQNNLETATKVGTLTITIPRLMLNGNSDITMSMTGSSQMNIEGQALAVEASECDDGGYYAIISKVIKNTTWTSNLAGLAIDNANHLKDGDFLNVYGVFYGIGTRPLTPDQYVVLPSNCVNDSDIIVYDGNEDLLITVILKDDSTKITQGIIEANQ